MHELKKKLLNLVPDYEANLILFHICQKTDESIKNFSDLTLKSPILTEGMRSQALNIAEQRKLGFLLQHLLGSQFFLNHDYEVDSSTLIPRPETEVLANHILDYVRIHFAERPFRFAELGIGSGILSGETLAAFPQARGEATELNPGAKALAERNFDRILNSEWRGRFQIHLAESSTSGFEAFVARSPFDLVFSNPPYVAMTDEIETQVIQHEPASALYPSNGDPHFFYSNFLTHAPTILSPTGAAFFEVPHERAQAILVDFVRRGFAQSKLIPDLTGRPRVLFAQRE